MGCKGSKSKKNAYARVAQYQKESYAADRALNVNPEPLDWVTPPPGCIAPSSLHNLLTDGFYAPFAANPRYVLLVDCRGEKAYFRRRLMTSHWHESLQNAPHPETCLSVVLYDEKPRTSAPTNPETDPLSQLYHDMKKRQLDPKIVVGGWAAIQILCRHLTIIGEQTIPKHKITLPWFPTLIIPGFLYLGQAETAGDPRILVQLRVSHIVTLSEVVPLRVLPSTNYLVVPLDEGDPVTDKDRESPLSGPDLVSSMPTILAFVGEARAFGGSVLVQCDLGLTRAAAVVMALLMAERLCSLEDAYYYVLGARTAIHLHPQLLQQLSAYEASIFGTAITPTEDLF